MIPIKIAVCPWDAPYDKDGLLSHCQACRASFDPKDSRVIGDIEPNGNIVLASCRSCRISTLMNVFISNAGVTVKCLLTDLIEADVARLNPRRGRVTHNDVLDVHVLLHEETAEREFIDDILDRL